MAKSKHQKLADLIKRTLIDIEEFLDEVTKVSEAFQIMTFEGFILLRPHSMTLKKIPILRRISRKQLNENFINREHEKLKLLLYCPAKDEFSFEIDWYERDDAANSFTHQLLTVQASLDEEALLAQNLNRDPTLLYQKALDEWQAQPSEASDPDFLYDLAMDPKKLAMIEFAPKPGQSIEMAYKSVLLSIRSRKFKHRHALRKMYQSKLVGAIFEGLNWNDSLCRSFLKEFNRRVFGEGKKSSDRSLGRWEQCKGIDRYTAARFIEHFVIKFINDPSDKQSGEIACILWLLIWCAQEDMTLSITLDQVLELSTQDITHEDRELLFPTAELEVSEGLHQLLLCLCGLGKDGLGLSVFMGVIPFINITN
jgi:hypothetical protein